MSDPHSYRGLKERLAGELALLRELTEACKADSGISDALIGNAFRHHVLSYRRILNEIEYPSPLPESSPVRGFDERWVQPGGIVPVDVQTTQILVQEVMRLRASPLKMDAGGGDLEILRMALGNTAHCLGDALATFNRLVGQPVFANSERLDATGERS